MSIILNDQPNKYKLDIEEVYKLNKKDIYYVSFYHQGNFHSRPIQIIGDSYAVYNRNYSECIREETNWKHIFKEKTITGNIVEKEIKYIDDSAYGIDDMRISLIGRTEDEAKIRFILFNLESKYLTEWEKVLLESELEYFNHIKPTLVKYVKTFKLYGQSGGLYNLDKLFTRNKDDILNKQFFV